MFYLFGSLVTNCEEYQTFCILYAVSGAGRRCEIFWIFANFPRCNVLLMSVSELSDISFFLRVTHWNIFIKEKGIVKHHRAIFPLICTKSLFKYTACWINIHIRQKPFIPGVCHKVDLEGTESRILRKETIKINKEKRKNGKFSCAGAVPHPRISYNIKMFLFRDEIWVENCVLILENLKV